MTFRDDHDAALARAEALERLLADERRRAEDERRRADHADARAVALERERAQLVEQVRRAGGEAPATEAAPEVTPKPPRDKADIKAAGIVMAGIALLVLVLTSRECHCDGTAGAATGPVGVATVAMTTHKGSDPTEPGSLLRSRDRGLASPTPRCRRDAI